ncbi:hypothetical protein NL676_031014 [Syzygium grande]|nr:hypothetical protein NL676_031014 [Syzygium grande]
MADCYSASPYLRTSARGQDLVARDDGERSAWMRRSTVARQPDLVCCLTAFRSSLGSSTSAGYKLNNFAVDGGGGSGSAPNFFYLFLFGFPSQYPRVGM